MKPFVYALSTCSHCKKAKKFLEEHDIEFDCIEVDLKTGDERTETVNEVKKHNPRCTFPTIVIGEVVIIGFKEEEIRKALDL